MAGGSEIILHLESLRGGPIHALGSGCQSVLVSRNTVSKQGPPRGKGVQDIWTAVETLEEGWGAPFPTPATTALTTSMSPLPVLYKSEAVVIAVTSPDTSVRQRKKGDGELEGGGGGEGRRGVSVSMCMGREQGGGGGKKGGSEIRGREEGQSG